MSAKPLIMRKALTLVVFVLCTTFSFAQLKESDFYGEWAYDNGKEFLKIYSEKDELKVMWKSWADGFLENYFNDLRIENNLLKGSHYGTKNNVVIKKEGNSVLLTIDPWHFKSVIDQTFYQKGKALYNHFQLSNEELVYAFKTKKGKYLSVCKDKEDGYLVYRFGNAEKIELQFPKKLDKSSWDKFDSHTYHRGGTAAMDEDHLSFEINGYRYKIVDERAIDQGDEHFYRGIEVLNLSTNEESFIQADSATSQGALMKLRDNSLINSITKREITKEFNKSGWSPETKFVIGDRKIKVYKEPRLGSEVVDELYNGTKVKTASTTRENKVVYYDKDGIQLEGHFVNVGYKKAKDAELQLGWVINDQLSNYECWPADTSGKSQKFLWDILRQYYYKDHEVRLNLPNSSFSNFYNTKIFYGIDEKVYSELQLDKIAKYDTTAIQRYDPTGGDKLKNSDHYNIVYSLNGVVDISENFYSIIVGYDYYNEYAEFLVTYSKNGDLIDFMAMSAGDNVESFTYSEAVVTRNHIVVNDYHYVETENGDVDYKRVSYTPYFIGKDGKFEKQPTVKIP